MCPPPRSAVQVGMRVAVRHVQFQRFGHTYIYVANATRTASTCTLTITHERPSKEENKEIERLLNLNGGHRRRFGVFFVKTLQAVVRTLYHDTDKWILKETAGLRVPNPVGGGDGDRVKQCPAGSLQHALSDFLLKVAENIATRIYVNPLFRETGLASLHDETLSYLIAQAFEGIIREANHLGWAGEKEKPLVDLLDEAANRVHNNTSARPLCTHK